MSRTIFAVAAVFVSLQLVPTPAVAQYYASAPRCAVISLGAGDVHWECMYEECRSTILAGKRGFCNPNPYFVAAPQRSRRARPY
ncbi:MAG: hypothetical protein WBX77_20330 [Pseudolabrys sp.]